MDEKIKIRQRKQEERYIVDYSKVKNRDQGRYEILDNLNQEKNLFMIIDTGLRIAENDKGIDKLPLYTREGQTATFSFLETQGINYRVRRRMTQVQKKILGIPIGKPKDVEEVILAMVFPKGSFPKEVFEHLIHFYDYMVGIDWKEDLSSVFQIFEKAEHEQVREMNLFEDDLTDSPYLGYAYTSYDFENQK